MNPLYISLDNHPPFATIYCMTTKEAVLSLLDTPDLQLVDSLKDIQERAAHWDDYMVHTTGRPVYLIDEDVEEARW